MFEMTGKHPFEERVLVWGGVPVLVSQVFNQRKRKKSRAGNSRMDRTAVVNYGGSLRLSMNRMKDWSPVTKNNQRGNEPQLKRLKKNTNKSSERGNIKDRT